MAGFQLILCTFIAVISVRGSVPTATSFLANLYAAMIPARGELQLEKSFIPKQNRFTKI